MSAGFDSPAAVDPPVELIPVVELPRLSIVHLMAWMAASAVAFVPYQIQLQRAPADNSGNEYWRSLMETMWYIVLGVVGGTCLFVAAVRLYWRWRGARIPFDPGHWLAIHGVGDWLVATLTSIVIFVARNSGGPSSAWITVPQLIFGLATLVGFFWLAGWSKETSAWRLAFFIIAFIPLLSSVVPMVATFIDGLSYSSTVSFITFSGMAGLQLLTLSIVAMSDVSLGVPRHWSHWLTIAAQIASCLMRMAVYSWIFLYLTH